MKYLIILLFSFILFSCSDSPTESDDQPTWDGTGRWYPYQLDADSLLFSGHDILFNEDKSFSDTWGTSSIYMNTGLYNVKADTFEGEYSTLLGGHQVDIGIWKFTYTLSANNDTMQVQEIEYSNNCFTLIRNER